MSEPRESHWNVMRCKDGPLSQWHSLRLPWRPVCQAWPTQSATGHFPNRQKCGANSWEAWTSTAFIDSSGPGGCSSAFSIWTRRLWRNWGVTKSRKKTEIAPELGRGMSSESKGSSRKTGQQNPPPSLRSRVVGPCYGWRASSVTPSVLVLLPLMWCPLQEGSPSQGVFWVWFQALRKTWAGN